MSITKMEQMPIHLPQQEEDQYSLESQREQ